MSQLLCTSHDNNHEERLVLLEKFSSRESNKAFRLRIIKSWNVYFKEMHIKGLFK